MRKLTVSDRLQKMEDNQDSFAKAIEKINQKLDSQTDQLNELNSKFDQLSGGKQALMWITGVSLTIAGLVIAFLNLHKH